MDIEIEIGGDKLVVRDVPETTWEALKLFWPPIAKAIIEVFLEGDFKPYGVRKNRKDGFYAAEWYWDRSLTYPEKYPLEEARRFLEMLMKKEGFIESIRKFNEQGKANWTSNWNIRQLRRFVYSICFQLEEFLRLLEMGMD